MEADFKMDLGLSVAVTVSSDRLTAYLQLIDPDIAGKFTENDLLELLKSNGVMTGVKQEALSIFTKNPLAYTSTPILAAEGTPPENGQDGYIDYVFTTRNEKRKPLELEDGSVDYREILQLSNVLKGQLLAERVPSTKGKPGLAVTGEEIPAKDGKESWFKLGKNVVVDQEKRKMYAVIDGLATQTEQGKLNVFPVYEINGDVDYHIGNIDFVGTVVVRGNVLSGFKIKASGDVRVTGGVEGAIIEAEGSVHISSGIFAGNKGYVKAGVDVKSSFLQEANVFAGQDIIVSQSILHSQIRAGRNVICKGSKGLIVGGTIQAGECVSARTIGNEMSTPTVIEIGVAPELRNEHQQLRLTKTQLTESLEKTEKALAILDQMASSGALTPDKHELRTKLLATKRTAVEDLAATKERIWEIENTLQQVEQAKLEVSGTIYAGTKVVIGRYTRFVKDSMKYVVFQLKGGEIALTSSV